VNPPRPPSIAVVDAFSARPFGGNPAAICVLPPGRPAEPAWMQRVAAEMNLSETAFLVPRVDGSWDLRWFTPAVEVDLCGHATLASAHLLWEDGLLDAAEEARFHTRSGLLRAARQADGWIELDFPATPAATAEPPAGLAEALGAPAFEWVGRSRFDYLVQLAAEQEVRSLRPDFARLRSLPVRGVIVTARSDSRFDFVSRFFAPGSGVDEDPVTGSAHCALVPFWAERLGRSDLLACQVSARSGELRLRFRGERVGIGGQAITVWRGALCAPAIE
jgi:PhzF family phenazine biosynthesis protein